MNKLRNIIPTIALAISLSGGVQAKTSKEVVAQLDHKADPIGSLIQEKVGKDPLGDLIRSLEEGKPKAQEKSNTTNALPKIQSSIRHLVPEKIASTEPTIIIGKIGNIQIIRAYKNGNLIVASVTSSGILKDPKTGKVHKTPDFGGSMYLSGETDKDHYSTSYGPKGVLAPGKKGAHMPYAIRISGPYWIHGSSKATGSPASHGCLRVPNSFAPDFYNFVNANPKGSVKLIVEGLY